MFNTSDVDSSHFSEQATLLLTLLYGPNSPYHNAEGKRSFL